MPIPSFLASQLRLPHGRFGRWIMSRILNQMNRPHHDLVFDCLNAQPDDHILEIGFGGGSMLERLHRSLKTGRITGIDPSADMVRRAKRIFQAAILDERVEILEGCADALPFKDKTFDRAYTVNTTYFWRDFRRGLHETARVLRPKGLFCIGYVDLEHLRTLGCEKQGFALIPEEEMRVLLSEAGFQEIKVTSRKARGELLHVMSAQRA